MHKHCLVLEGGAARYPAVDFLRGFSIFTVVLMHLLQSFVPSLPTLLYQAAALGGTGAHVFLFCSGFGLFYSYLRAPVSLGSFFSRRFGRVYCAYLPVVLVSALVPSLYAGADRLGALLSHVLLYKMFVPRYAESFGMQFWFVSTILQLYLLFIPLCLLRRRMGGMRRLVWLALGLSVGWWVFLAVTGLYVERIWNSFCLQFLWEFVLGMAVAEHLHGGGRICLRRGTLALTAVLGLGLQAGISLWGGYPLRLFNDLPSLFGYGALVLLLYHVAGNAIRRLFGALSRMAYAWYLTHFLVFTLVFTCCPDGIAAELGFGFAAFALSLLAAWGYSALLSVWMPKQKEKRI
ncbi:MAG: acyltransferase [Clostridia bacterium]|nr:acyltransferase [Clostridia bacterium]